MVSDFEYVACTNFDRIFVEKDPAGPIAYAEGPDLDGIVDAKYRESLVPYVEEDRYLRLERAVVAFLDKYENSDSYQDEEQNYLALRSTLAETNKYRSKNAKA